jgi:hypothetical protein
MYTLLIEGELNVGKKDEFLKVWSSEMLPLLKEQEGFVDEFVTFEEDNQVCGLAFWNTRKGGEHYRREVFPQVKNLVQHLMRDTSIRGFAVGATESFMHTPALRLM